MKAIAEYFRDLAAEDRYFGAEPPTPDAAMLHRIAEREIHAKVEAKIQDNGVILRAGDAMPAQVAAPRPSLLDAETSSPTESVASRLQRIRARHNAEAAAAPQANTVAAVSLTMAQAPDEDVIAEAGLTDLTDSYDEDQHADSAEADLESAAPEDSADLIDIPVQIEDILDEAENDQALADYEDDGFGSDVAEIEIAKTESAEPESALIAEPPTGPAVEVAEVASFVTDNLIEDADQDDDFADDDALLASLSAGLPELAPASLAVDVADLPEDLDLAEDAAFDEDALLMRLGGGAVVDTPIADMAPTQDDVWTAPSSDATLPDTLAADEDEAEDDDQPLAALDKIATRVVIETVDQDAAEDLSEADAVTADLAREEPITAPAPAQRARARVIRIRRTEVDATLVVEPLAEQAPAAAAQAPLETELSDEAEAALQAELAALEAELNEDDTFIAEATPVVAPAIAAPTEPRRHIEPTAEADAVNRLMEQAGSEMGGEDILRRQSAIAHLKAAVAATVADRMVVGSNPQSAEGRQDAYREDLDRVVRPRRPSADGATARPADLTAETGARATPLMLVSAQRIDRAETATAPVAPTETAPRMVMPVRPRRIDPALTVTHAPVVIDNTDQSDMAQDDDFAAEAEDNVFADSTSFQDFADQLGASALPDLLEAAAVYCAEVLQRPEFSRPLVMRQMAGIAGQTETAREDYLRGFGTLLRQGRITKVKRGMFALTDRSPYLAEARKIAG